jgi:hypothetical protein
MRPQAKTRSRGAGQALYDDVEHFGERYAPPTFDLLIKKLRLLVVYGRCRQRDVVVAVGKLHDLGEEAFDGFAG